MNFRKLHFAKCSNCGYTTNNSSSGTFIRHFCLPKMCSNCGEDMNERGHRYDPPRAHWLHVVLKEKKMKNPNAGFITRMLGIEHWKEVERSEFPAW